MKEMNYDRKRRCVNCKKMTDKWHRINGGPWHCWDGCYSTTGYDFRTVDGIPLWRGGKKLDLRSLS